VQYVQEEVKSECGESDDNMEVNEVDQPLDDAFDDVCEETEGDDDVMTDESMPPAEGDADDDS